MLASTLTECQDDPTHNLSIASQIQVSCIVSVVNTKNGKAEVASYDLVKRWNIGLETAKRTLLKTTQRGLRTSPNPLLSQWYSTNDGMLRYRRLPVDLFTDTLDAGIVSHRANKYAQVYAHRNTWCKAYAMATKSDAHETLSLLFAQEGVPSTLVMDGAREQVMGEFRHNSRQADCHLKQTEPYPPWQNAAKGTIRELKNSAGRKMIKANSPKKLWDDCIKLEMEIRSCTSNSVFELKEVKYQGQS